ncbi:glycosyltransferase family 4 protein [Flavobacterium sp. MAHUQ-51]|uniref:glycosyltransferase family 4 protein n=1 Tax=Flavobacterium sp. GCM10022190 TaxID=3252639 RepID=UPI003614735A
MDVNQKKIAVICNYELLPERVGGMDYFFWAFDEKCKENGVKVDWFFPNFSTHGKYSNLHIYSADDQSLERFFIDFQNKNKTNYTYIITHFLELCTPFYYKVSKIANAKMIAVDHNPRPLEGYPIKKKIQKRLKGLLYSRYISLFVGVSNYTTNEIIKDFGILNKSKLLTIYNGVLIEDIMIRYQRNTVKPSFLVVSHLRKSKGIQDLIEAVAALPEKIKDEIKIDIYGDGPYKLDLESKIRKNNLEANFNFKGSVATIKSIYHQYDYLVQPSHMECFSLSILESLAANVPVIATTVGGNTELIVDGENGFIITPKNIEELKAVIESVFLGDKKITNNTRSLIEHSFSLKKMVEKHWELVRH